MLRVSKEHSFLWSALSFVFSQRTRREQGISDTFSRLEILGSIHESSASISSHTNKRISESRILLNTIVFTMRFFYLTVYGRGSMTWLFLSSFIYGASQTWTKCDQGYLEASPTFIQKQIKQKRFTLSGDDKNRKTTSKIKLLTKIK